MKYHAVLGYLELTNSKAMNILDIMLLSAHVVFCSFKGSTSPADKNNRCLTVQKIQSQIRSSQILLDGCTTMERADEAPLG